MKLFVGVYFGLSVFCSFAKAMQLMFKTYPRQETFTLGEDCARLVEGVTTALIAAYILWG